MRKQFPLRPAAAKTVHRCQGDTLNEVVIDMSGRRSQCHIHYVALSRVTSLTGLYILSLNPTKINVDQNVVKEMKELRTTRVMKTAAPNIHNVKNTKVLHQNVRSLKKHLADIKSSALVLSSDILVFTECQLSRNVRNQDLHIDGYNIFKSFPLDVTESAFQHGIVIYTKEHIVTVKQQTLNFNNVEITLTTHNTNSSKLQIVAIYRSKKVPMQQFLEALKKLHTIISVTIPTLIIGDFNVDLFQHTSDKNNLLSLLVKSFHYRQVVNAVTTDYQSCLDHIYTNIAAKDVVSSGILESFYSDHKAVWITL